MSMCKQQRQKCSLLYIFCLSYVRFFYVVVKNAPEDMFLVSIKLSIKLFLPQRHETHY